MAGRSTTNRLNATVARLEVKVGDTVDFVVESLATLTNDQHAWTPIVRLLSDSPAASATHPQREWKASADFSGQRLNLWEDYAQAAVDVERDGVCGLSRFARFQESFNNRNSFR